MPLPHLGNLAPRRKAHTNNSLIHYSFFKTFSSRKSLNRYSHGNSGDYVGCDPEETGQKELWGKW